MTQQIMGAPATMHAFLFTDIAGSTALWERFPSEMERAYARHDAILRHAASDRGGVVFKVIGDAFQIAFPSVDAALGAAVAAQQALCAEAWTLPLPLRVRMALHSGEITADLFGDYRSPMLNRLGRLLGASHGGQILVSGAMAHACANLMPDGCSLRSLGRHRLRDFPEPESIHQVLGPGLPADFAPIVTAEQRRFNLPAPPNPIIGREEEIERITTLFERDVRLVTLTGPGGAGKTRLALEAGSRLRNAWGDGVALMELAPITDPALVLSAIADGLGVRSDGEQSPGEALANWLANREILLILDNFEQVIDAAVDVACLIANAPGLRLLVTSREALRVRAERVLPVELLAVPDPSEAGDLESIAKSPSVQLFLERATAVSPRFQLETSNADAIAAICRQVEGLPLAIELAAARVTMLSPTALLARLEQRLELLTGGARDLPDRQQTLRATIAWSYELLSNDNQRLFRALAVFSGGFDLAAAVGVCESLDEVRLLAELHALADKNLLNRVIRGEDLRFVMLESVREFAIESLALAGEEPAARHRHAGWFHHWVVSAQDLNDPAGLDRLEREHNNLRAAIAWSDAAGDASINLELAGTLARFWQFRGYVSEGRALLDRALMQTQDNPSPARLKALSESGTLANANGDYPGAVARFEAARDMADALGDEGAMAAALNSLGGVALAVGDTARAETLFARSLEIAEAANDAKRRLVAMSNLGAVAHYRGDLPAARARYVESLSIARALNDLFNIALLTGNLLILLAPDPESASQAASFGEESLRCYDQLGDHQGKGFAYDGLGTIAEVQGDGLTARRYYEQSLAQFRAAEDPSGISKAIGGLGSAALLQGDMSGALALYRESLRGYLELEEQDSVAVLLDAVAGIAVRVGAMEVAASLLGTSDRVLRELDVALPSQSLEQRRGSVEAARRSLGEAEFEAAFSAGGELSIESAVHLACSFQAGIDTEIVA